MKDDSVLKPEQEDGPGGMPGPEPADRNAEEQPGMEPAEENMWEQPGAEPAGEAIKEPTIAESAGESMEEQPTAEQESAEARMEEQSAAEAVSETAETETESETGIVQLYNYVKASSAEMRITAGASALLAVLLGVCIFSRIRKLRKKTAGELVLLPGQEEEQDTPYGGSVGKLHNIGSRQAQQDSFGIKAVDGGLFAVVADGMGGLSDGDKISQMIVKTMLHDAKEIRPGPKDQTLFEMVSHANHEVNRMLGSTEYFKSGSTVVAALIEKERFHWVSVGDSRVYLYRNERLIQLNREHTYEAELLVRAVNGEIPFDDITSNKERHGLTSFIGMGELKYIDGSRRGIRIHQGDRLLLMTDGVFNTVSEEEICQVMDRAANARDAANKLYDRVLSYENKRQDNFTAVIMDL